MNYIKLTYTVSPVVPGNEILMAHLSEAGFESFVESDTGFEAFVPEADFNEVLLPVESEFEGIQFEFTKEEIEQKNWNEEWEKSFSPVMVDDKCCIRADFHPPCGNVKLEVIITPKMSFGTGHHDTTWLMVKHLFETDLKKKSFLDMGCGTGVLAIVASKLGADPVLGIDIDEWSIENAKENCLLNAVNNIEILLGDASLLGEQKFDVIAANINRNVLLRDIPVYSSVMNAGGTLLLSGFFESDFEVLKGKAESCGLRFAEEEVRNGWGMLKFMC